MPFTTTETNVATLSGTLDASLAFTQLILPNGQTVRVQTSLLLGDPTAAALTPGTSSLAAGDTQVIPLIEEQLVVGKQTVETAKIRLIKATTEYQEQLHEPLAVRTFDIERIVLNQPVDAAPAVRQEGDTTVYPVVEEQLVLTKRLVLKEELRITRRDTERVDEQVITLRREHLIVEREELKN